MSKKSEQNLKEIKESVLITEEEMKVLDNKESIAETQVTSNFEEMTFNSYSQEIRYYFLQTLSDGKEHSRKELVSALSKSKRSNEFTNAMIINVLRGMVKYGQIISTERGKYIMAGTGADGLVNQLITVLKRNRSQLVTLANINYINVNDDEMEVLNKIKKCILILDETINELS